MFLIVVYIFFRYEWYCEIGGEKDFSICIYFLVYLILFIILILL